MVVEFTKPPSVELTASTWGASPGTWTSLLILDESQDGSAHRLRAKRVHRSQHETGAHHYTKHVFAHGCFLHSVLPVWVIYPLYSFAGSSIDIPRLKMPERSR